MISPQDIAAGMVKAPTTTSAGEPLASAGVKAWAEALVPFAEAGFAAVEIHNGWLDFPSFGSREVEQLRAALDQAGLSSPTAAIARNSVLEPGVGVKNLDYTLRGLEIAAELGGTVVCVGLHPVLNDVQREARYFWEAPGRKDVADQETWDLAVDRLSTIAKRAAELGQLISLEIYEDTLLGNTESALRLVGDIGMPNVGLNPDIGTLIRLNRPVEHWRDMLTAMLPISNYWHVKNYTRTEVPGGFDTSPTTLEHGLIDYREALDIAERSGFNGVLVCEQYSDDWLEVLAENRLYLSGLLDDLSRQSADSGVLS